MKPNTKSISHPKDIHYGKLLKLSSILLILLWGLLPAAQGEPLKLHGAVVAQGLIEPNIAEIRTKSGIDFEVVGNGSDVGLLDLVQGRAVVAMISAPLEDLAKKINLKQPGAVDLTNLKTIPLGTSKFVLIVNTNNPVRRLTDQQAIGILTGKITSWKEVGGADRTVQVIAPPANGGVSTAFQSKLLKGEKFTPDAKDTINPRVVQSMVAQDPRAVGPLAVSVLSEKVAVVKLDSVIETPVSLVVRGEPSAAVTKLADTIKPFVK